jgi:hypothetical protein
LAWESVRGPLARGIQEPPRKVVHDLIQRRQQRRSEACPERRQGREHQPGVVGGLVLFEGPAAALDGVAAQGVAAVRVDAREPAEGEGQDREGAPGASGGKRRPRAAGGRPGGGPRAGGRGSERPPGRAVSGPFSRRARKAKRKPSSSRASEASEGLEEVGEGAQVRQDRAGGQQAPRVALRGELLVEERELLRKREEREVLRKREEREIHEGRRVSRRGRPSGGPVEGCSRPG